MWLLPWAALLVVGGFEYLTLVWLVKQSRSSCLRRWSDQTSVQMEASKRSHEKKVFLVCAALLFVLAGLCLPFQDYLPTGIGAALSLAVCGLMCLILALVNRRTGAGS